MSCYFTLAQPQRLFNCRLFHLIIHLFRLRLRHFLLHGLVVQQEDLLFNVPSKPNLWAFFGLLIEITNVNIGNLSEQSPAKQLVVLVFIFIFHSLFRVDIHQHFKDVVRETRLGWLIPGGCVSACFIRPLVQLALCSQSLVKNLSSSVDIAWLSFYEWSYLW